MLPISGSATRPAESRSSSTLPGTLACIVSYSMPCICSGETTGVRFCSQKSKVHVPLREMPPAVAGRRDIPKRMTEHTSENAVLFILFFYWLFQSQVVLTMLQEVLTLLMNGISTTMKSQARVKATRAAPWVPKLSVTTPSTGGIIAPPQTPTISRAETSLVF